MAEEEVTRSPKTNKEIFIIFVELQSYCMIEQKVNKGKKHSCTLFSKFEFLNIHTYDTTNGSHEDRARARALPPRKLTERAGAQPRAFAQPRALENAKPNQEGKLKKWPLIEKKSRQEPHRKGWHASLSYRNAI
jgi:hypothetical protein